MAIDSTDSYYTKARSGEAFIVSEVYNVVSGEHANIHLRNPDESGSRFWVMGITVESDGPYIAQIHDSFDNGISGGTEVEIENVLLDSDGNMSDDGVAVVNEDVTFSSSRFHAAGVGGGGSGGNSSGFTTNHPPIVIEEGREVILDVENTGSNENNYALTIVYYETPMRTD